MKTGERRSEREERRAESRITHHAFLLLAAFQLLSFSAFPATVTFPLYRWNSDAATNRSVMLTPLALYPGPNQVAAYDRGRYTSDTNGTFTVSNMMAGSYQVEIQAPPDATRFWITVPATNATLYASDLVVVPTNSTISPNSLAYSITASDARYAPVGSISASASQTNWPASAITNAPWITNGQTLASLTINSTAEADPALTIQTDTDTAPTLEIKTGSMLIGRIHPAGLTNWLAGAFTADAFYGDGAGLTNLQPAALAGPVAEADHATWSDYAEYVVYVTNRIAYATNAENAQSANTVSGVISLTNLPAGIVTNNQSGVTLSGAFEGSGYGLSNVFSQTGFRSTAGFPIVNVTCDSPEEYSVTWNTIGFSATNVLLSGQFSGGFIGNGEGLTNIAPAAIASAPWLTGASNIAGARITGTITNQVSTASYTDYVNSGTNIVISPTNGNLQSWTLTNASWAQLAAANTNFTETIRMNIYSSNTLTWASGTLSNATVLGPSNAISVMLFDHVRGTNLWQGYRLR